MFKTHTCGDLPSTHIGEAFILAGCTLSQSTAEPSRGEPVIGDCDGYLIEG